MHRLFGMAIGYCGPAANRTSEKFKIKKDRLRRARLFVLDELSMIGRMMLGKIEFQVRDHLGNQPSTHGSEVFMGNKDLVLCGDPKQCPPIGDDPMYRNGEYSGRGENKPSDAARCATWGMEREEVRQGGLAFAGQLSGCGDSSQGAQVSRC